MGYLTFRDIKPGTLGPETQGVPCYNDAGGALSVGQLVYVSGWTTTPGNAGEYIRKVKLADADGQIPANRATYVVVQALSSGGYGRVARAAVVRGVDTSGVSVAGDPVYLDTTAGAFTATAPTAAAANTQRVGYAVTKSATGIVAFDLTAETETFGNQGVLSGSVGGVKLSLVTPMAAAGALMNTNMGAEGVLILDIPDAASGNVDFTGLPFKIQVTGVAYIKTGGAGNLGNSVAVHNGTTGNAITSLINSPTDTNTAAPTTLDDAYWEIAAGATIRVVTVRAGGNNACRLVIRYARVA